MSIRTYKMHITSRKISECCISLSAFTNGICSSSTQKILPNVEKNVINAVSGKSCFGFAAILTASEAP